MDAFAGLIAIAVVPMIVVFSYFRDMGGDEQPRASAYADFYAYRRGTIV